MARTLAVAAAALASVAGRGWLYSGARTMQESVGFELGVSLRALVLGGVLAALAIAFAGMIAELAPRRPGPVVRGAALAVLVPMGIGPVAAEVAILVDEARFRDEVAVDASRRYSRARAWPNENSALVYRPEYGITATD